MSRSRLKRMLYIAQGFLIILCIGIYTADMLLGDGDGINAKYGINPLKLFFQLQIPLLLLWGLLSRKKWLINTSLVLSSLIVGLVLVNWLLKLHAGPPTLITSSNCHPFTSFDTTYFKNNRPNCSYTFRRKALDGEATISYTINSDGMRGDEVQPKELHKSRILLIGDSYIEAKQVAEPHMVSKQLEKMFADSVEVLQHGFSSWSPLLELNWLLKKGLSLEPDLVVLYLYYNDFYAGNNVGDSGYWPFTQFDEKDYPVRFQFDETNPYQKRNPVHLLWRDIENWQLLKSLSYAKRHAALVKSLPADSLPSILALASNAFQYRYDTQDFEGNLLFSSRWDLLALMRDTSLWSGELRERVDLSLQLVKRMQVLLEQQDIAFIVSLIPYPWQLVNEGEAGKAAINWQGVQFEESGLQLQVSAFCENEKIRYLDLYSYFKAYKAAHPNEQLYFTLDRHWNEKGHAVAAESLFDFIIERDSIF